MTIVYTLYTADMPAIVKGGDDYLQCLVYADDLPYAATIFVPYNNLSIAFTDTVLITILALT